MLCLYEKLPNIISHTGFNKSQTCHEEDGRNFVFSVFVFCMNNLEKLISFTSFFNTCISCLSGMRWTAVAIADDTYFHMKLRFL